MVSISQRDNGMASHAVMHILYNPIKLASEASYLTVTSAVDEMAMFAVCFIGRAGVSFGVLLS